jgi:hypothetical protein
MGSMHAPSPRKPSLNADQRRALRLLASSPDGCPEALFLAHGFTANLVEALITAGFVAAETRHMRAGGRVVVVQRLQITDAGRQAIG